MTLSPNYLVIVVIKFNYLLMSTNKSLLKITGLGVVVALVLLGIGWQVNNQRTQILVLELKGNCTSFEQEFDCKLLEKDSQSMVTMLQRTSYETFGLTASNSGVTGYYSFLAEGGDYVLTVWSVIKKADGSFEVNEIYNKGIAPGLGLESDDAQEVTEVNEFNNAVKHYTGKDIYELY